MNLDILRHSCSHIMASAVKKLYPEVKLGIGPAIEDGFYYDFDSKGVIKDEIFPRIEELMREIIKKNEPFIKEIWEKSKAREFFKQKEEVYKLELIEQIEGDEVTIYRHNDFVDLCKGPHLNSTDEAQYFKLLSVSGAYWKGDENNPQLTRIYGTAFFSQEELDAYLLRIAEAKKRDHRLVGKSLKLFDIYYNEAGAGLVFYLPRGAILRKIIEDWEIEEHRKRGYELVITPHIMHKDLWKKSGHLDHYSDYMYSVNKNEQEFILKPMNCPGHMLIYKSELRSWRQLPLRFFELGTVYRYEKSGVLQGLLRLRGFTQDDAHIFCSEEELPREIEGVLNFVKATMHKFGFDDFKAELSTRPEKFIGDVSKWNRAEEILEDVLKKENFSYRINAGDGAFYGPKIDISLRDALKRSWQCATIQLDYSLPERFNLTYHAQDGTKQRVIMIHRVILGSMERFIATLIEHYAGKFPLWLAPVQINVLNVTEDVKDYALAVKNALEKKGYRVEADLSDETLQKRIREKELEKIPYLVIVGRKEKEEGLISLRQRGRKNLGQMSVESFFKILEGQEEVAGLKKEVDN
ncbi:MAG: threonine--tRNA ligase [Candidatus Omnitrophica bacterium]|nr:threonine--tRNA ligase [Candidatus Omnitrophota bacterium]